MSGATDSVIGMKDDSPIERFLTGMPRSYEPAKGDIELQGVVLDIDSGTGRCRSIVRVKRAL